MNEDDIKAQLRKPAIELIAGGFRPSDTNEESWFGKVFLLASGEEVPVDESGRQMLPLAQFYLPGLSVSSALLKTTKLITVFATSDCPGNLEPMGDSWVLREYSSLDEVERRDELSPKSFVKPFPLTSRAVEEDYPLWDGGGIPFDMEQQIAELERSGEVGNYYDYTTHCYGHKFGGYPSFCQSGIYAGDDFEFVFQISSDSKINLNVVDNGSLMFWKNRRTGEWLLYYDFY